MSAVHAAPSKTTPSSSSNSAAVSSSSPLNKPGADSSSSSASSPSAVKNSTDIRCAGFEAQVFRKNRCKKCLRDKADHNGPSGGSQTTSVPLPVKPPDVSVKKA